MQMAERPARRHDGSWPASSPKASISTPTGPVVLGYGINVQSDGLSAGTVAIARRRIELNSAALIDRCHAVRRDAGGARASRYDDLLDGRFDAILDAWRAARQRQRRARCSVGHAPTSGRRA